MSYNARSYVAWTWATEEEAPEDMPLGVIAMWSDLWGTTPNGWALCDGTANAPGPDLRDKFVVCAGASHTVDNTGGSATAILNHTHGVNVVDSGHLHGLYRYPTATGALSGFTADTSMSGTLTAVTLTSQSAATGITATTNNPAGGVASVEPPFYVLKFIQRMV